MSKTTGTGPLTYRARPIELSSRIKQHMEAAHSAFVPDRALDGGHDSTWFSLKGVGPLRLTPELDRIADRENARLESFTSTGRYVGGLALPPGARPCSVDYYDRLALVACLEGPGGSTPAPIYVFDDGNLVSEINIGRDLGLAGFAHIHNAAFRVVENGDGSSAFFVLAYAWDPGNLAILEPA